MIVDTLFFPFEIIKISVNLISKLQAIPWWRKRTDSVHNFPHRNFVLALAVRQNSCFCFRHKLVRGALLIDLSVLMMTAHSTRSSLFFLERVCGIQPKQTFRFWRLSMRKRRSLWKVLILQPWPRETIGFSSIMFRKLTSRKVRPSLNDLLYRSTVLSDRILSWPNSWSCLKIWPGLTPRFVSIKLYAR